MKNIIVDGVKYIPESEAKKEKEKDLKGLEYCIVRTYSAGVFAGYYDRKTVGQEGTVFKARRIWYWTGAASLSQLAVDGTSSPSTCQFPEEVAEIDLKQIVEVLPCTEKSRLSISEVKIWKQ